MKENKTKEILIQFKMRKMERHKIFKQANKAQVKQIQVKQIQKFSKLLRHHRAKLSLTHL